MASQPNVDNSRLIGIGMAVATLALIVLIISAMFSTRDYSSGSQNGSDKSKLEQFQDNVGKSVKRGMGDIL